METNLQSAATYKPAGRTSSASIIGVALQHRWYILWRAVLITSICAIAALLIPLRYESLAELMPPDQSSSSSIASAAGERAASLIGIPPDLIGEQSQGSLFVKILTSHSAEDAIIGKFDLRKVYRVRYWQDARTILEKNTNVALDRKSGVITITVRDKDPKRAQAMCQAYVDELNHLSGQLSTSAARRERQFLEERLKVIKTELDNSAAQLGTFSSTNSTLDISQQGKSMMDAVATLQRQLISSEAELDGLKKIYGQDNVRVISSEARIAALRQNIANMAGREGHASPDPNLPYPSIRALPLLGVTYSQLLQRTEIDASIYQLLSKEYEVARMQEAKDIPAVRLLDSPNYPERSVRGRWLLVAWGGVLGILLMTFWVYLKQVSPELFESGIVAQVYSAAQSDLHQFLGYFTQRKSE